MSKLIKETKNNSDIEVYSKSSGTAKRILKFISNGGLVIGSAIDDADNIKIHRSGSGEFQFVKGNDTTPDGEPSGYSLAAKVPGICPIGSIIPWIGGLFTGTDNSGYSHSLGSGNTIADANTYLNPLGWHICDGATPIVANSPLNLDGTRHLPHLTDNRFLQGNTSMGDAGGNTSTTLTSANLPTHTHGVGTFSLSYAGDHTHQIDHTHATFTSAAESGHYHTVSGSTNSDTHNHASFSYKGYTFYATYLEANAFGHPTYNDGNLEGSNLGVESKYIKKTINTSLADKTHSHSYSTTSGVGSSHSHSVSVPSYSGTSGNISIAHNHTISGSTDNGSFTNNAIENRPNYLSVFYIIRVS